MRWLTVAALLAGACNSDVAPSDAGADAIALADAPPVEDSSVMRDLALRDDAALDTAASSDSALGDSAMPLDASAPLDATSDGGSSDLLAFDLLRLVDAGPTRKAARRAADS